MLSPSEQAHLNLDQARNMRADGISYREIGRALALTSSQLSHIRRALKRAKASQTKLRRADPAATDRDLPLSQSVLPPGLRQILKASGLVTLGDVAARIGDPELLGLEALPGVGPHRALLIKGLLDHHGLLPGPEDLRSEIEALFPEFGDADPA